MRTTGMVVVVVVFGGLGCFSTARYDDAHARRVASINARYEAERAEDERRQVELVAMLESHEAMLIPVGPLGRLGQAGQLTPLAALGPLGPLRPAPLSGPVSRVDERDDIVECRDHCERRGIDDAVDGWHTDDKLRTQCLHQICEPAYADALTKTYADADLHWVMSQLARSDGADIEALMALSHNQAVSHHIEDERRELAQLRARAGERRERERQAEIAASAQRRDAEVSSERSAHRARIQAAAFAARDGDPINARPSSVCAAGDDQLSRITGCRSELPVTDPGPALPPSLAAERPPTAGP
jgi:hypothetical protein